MTMNVDTVSTETHLKMVDNGSVHRESSTFTFDLAVVFSNDAIGFWLLLFQFIDMLVEKHGLCNAMLVYPEVIFQNEDTSRH